MELAGSTGTLIPKAALPAGLRNKLGRTESGDLATNCPPTSSVSDGGRERPNRKDLDAAPTEQAGSNKRASKRATRNVSRQNFPGKRNQQNKRQPASLASPPSIIIGITSVADTKSFATRGFLCRSLRWTGLLLAPGHRKQRLAASCGVFHA